MDNAEQLQLLLDDYFEKQLKQIVHLLNGRQGKRRYSGVCMQVIDLPQGHSGTQHRRVDETCWQILLTDDYFIDSTNHLLTIRKEGIGILMRVDWHNLPPSTVVDLLGKLRLMEFALQRS